MQGLRSGSPLDALESSARNAEIDRQAIIYQGHVRAAGYEDQATLDTMQASSDLTTGIFRGVGNLAEGASAFLTRRPSAGTALPVNSAFFSSSYNPLAGLGGAPIPA